MRTSLVICAAAALMAGPVSLLTMGGPATGAEPPASGGPAWDVAVTEAGVSLRLGAEKDIMHLSCTRNPAVMTAVVDGFKTVGSEERLTVGVGEDLFVFVADTAANRPPGVYAQAPISIPLLARLQKPGTLSAVYGAQDTGPLAQPPAKLVRQFAAACRRIAVETPPPSPTGVTR